MIRSEPQVISYVAIARMPTEKAHGASIAHMCASFAALGKQVELVIPERRNEITEDIFSYYGVPRTFSVRTIRVPDFVGRGLTHPVFFFLQRLLFIRAAKRAGIMPGVVYTREPEIAAAFSSTHRAVYEAHRWPRGIAGWLTGRLIRHTTLVVCNSRGTEAAVRSSGVTCTLVAPNGFDPVAFQHAESKEQARIRLGLPQNAKIALYVGSLETHKGVKTLYIAGQLLQPDVTTVVIGGDEQTLHKLKARFPDIYFLGSRPYRELANNLSAADVLILPNTKKDEESARFTSPIKAFGYMAARRPIVTSDLPSLREVLDEESAYFVRSDDPAALAKGIRAVLVDATAGDARATRAQERVYGYTWAARAMRIMQVLDTAP
ncbi:glycosyltransferase family 4 protein [Candidatus Parcubacteria bacterium]|nr:glycosyltransferase family 4 protein [Candidatus Parcubacteria bacterium]